MAFMAYKKILNMQLACGSLASQILAQISDVQSFACNLSLSRGIAELFWCYGKVFLNLIAAAPNLIKTL